MKKSVILIILLLALIASYIGMIADIKTLKAENTYLKNEFNHIQARLETMDTNDDRLYGYAKTFGNNDLILKEQIDELKCLVLNCVYAWNE